jgi:hypothetical protein
VRHLNHFSSQLFVVAVPEVMTIMAPNCWIMETLQEAQFVGKMRLYRPASKPALGLLNTQVAMLHKRRGDQLQAYDYRQTELPVSQFSVR